MNSSAVVCRFFLLGCVLVYTSLAFDAQARDRWDNIDRIVAIGDLHGDYDQYLQVLRDNQLIDTKLNWRGGKTHLVQLGDVPDRGPDSLKIMRHMRQLEKQAKRQRGYVHALLGNHEVMNIHGDLRYVHPGEYQALVTDQSPLLQSRYLDRVLAYEQKQGLLPALPEALQAQRLQDRRAQLSKQYPLGFVEQRTLWAPRGEAFEWVKSHNALIKLNRTLFVHGGIAPNEPLLPISKINKLVRKAMRAAPEEPGTPGDILGEQGPLWYRGLANRAGDEAAVKLMLDYYDADTIVIAHTPTSGAIMPGENGHVIQVDVGLGQAYGKHRANLLIEADHYYAVQRGQRLPLPRTDAALIPYLQQALELEPDPAAIQQTIDQLMQP